MGGPLASAQAADQQDARLSYGERNALNRYSKLPALPNTYLRLLAFQRVQNQRWSLDKGAAP
jgi:hypothetical protein